MKRSNRIGSRIFIGLTFLFLYLPIFLLIIFSFNAGDSSAVWKGFSLDWYAALFQNRLIMESLYTTLLVSLLATVISTAAGTFAAIGLYALSRRKRDALLVVNDIPMMNADIVTFAISSLLGGGNEMMLGDLIELQFLGGAYNPHLGAAISMVMMVIVVVCMVVMNHFGEGEEQAVIM